MSFRQAFKLVSKQPIRWYPGHMNKGMVEMQKRLRCVDCIIEVHDARVPFTGRNPIFNRSITGGVKPHILVLNKKDLTEVREQRRIVKELQEREGIEHVIFTNCKKQWCPGTKRLLPMVKDLINNSSRYNREGERDFTAMIIGVPNVGKSSLLNVLRNRHLKKKNATQVGANAGVTRSVLEKIKINDDPLTYMIDTPGILEPCIQDDEMGMKLALIGCLPDHLVGEELIADYLLYWLNKYQRFDYAKLMHLKEPTDHIGKALVTCANIMDVRRKVKTYDGRVILVPDTLIAAKYFIKLFRTGELGPVNLDCDFLQNNEQQDERRLHKNKYATL